MSSYETYNCLGNPYPRVGDIIRCDKPTKGLIGEAIYHVDAVHGYGQGFKALCLSDREDGNGSPVKGCYGPWRFRLLRRGT